MRLLFLILGTICVALAIIGVVLPLLPTTPFLLLAGACYARGSDRAHAWLLANPLLGPTIERWEQERTISVRAKTAAIGLMAVMMGIGVFITAKLWIGLILLVIFLSVSAYLLSVPSSRPTPPAGDD